MKIRDGIVKKGWCFAVILLFVGASVVPHVGSEKIELERSNLLSSTQQDEVHVNNDYNYTHPGWNVTHFDNIQDGIDNVDADGTVFVHNGTYCENLFIDEKLTLQSEDEDEWGNDTNGSIICGPTVSVLIIGVESSGTKIFGFIINNSAVAGILILNTPSVTISDNKIKSNSKKGIHIISSDGCIISYNNISNNDDFGIWIGDSQDCKIEWNHIINHTGGIELLISGDNIIYKNHIENNIFNIWIEDNTEKNDISENNFIEKPNRFRFAPRYRNSKNDWDENYWSNRRPYLPFYVVWGRFRPTTIPWFQIPCFQFDINPHDEKYEIPIPGPHP